MGKVAADALLLGHCLRCGTRCPRLHVVEADMSVHEIADRLHAGPTGVRGLEQAPRLLRQKVGIAIPASLQKHEGLERQILNRVLPRAGHGGIRLARVAEDAIRRQAEVALRGHHPRAPVAEPVAVAFQRHTRLRYETVGTLQIAKARVVDVQHRNQWRRLREAVAQTAPDADAHAGPATTRKIRITVQGRTSRQRAGSLDYSSTGCRIGRDRRSPADR